MHMFDVAQGALKEDLMHQISLELAARATADRRFDTMMRLLTSNSALVNYHTDLRNHECFEAAIQGVQKACGRFTEYTMARAHNIGSLCDNGVSAASIIAAAKNVC